MCIRDRYQRRVRDSHSGSHTEHDMSFSIKVTHDNDTRKISCTPETVLDQVADRFERTPTNFQLLLHDEPVDAAKIALIAASKPGETVKYTLVDTLVDTHDFHFSDSGDSGNEARPDKAEAKAAKQAAKQAAKAIKQASKQAAKQAAKAAKQSAKQAKTEAQQQAWVNIAQRQDDYKNTSSDDEFGDISGDRLCELTDEEIDPKILKQQLMTAKQAANQARKEAKLAEKQAKLAAKEAAAAERAEAKAAAKAEKQAAKARAKDEFAAKNKKNPNKLIPGKLVNWEASDSIAGDLIMLPCGRVCFHAVAHPGNLRIAKQQVQRKGGTGEAAQFVAHPMAEKPSVFRLSSQANSGLFLGVLTTDGAKSPDNFALGGEFAVVDGESPAGLWSFCPHDTGGQMLELEAPAPPLTPHQVYTKLQWLVGWISSNTGLQIRMENPPTDECELVTMLNALFNLLPHPMQRVAMKKAGLREFEMPAQPEQEDPHEWDLMVQDLQDMGFDSLEENRKAVQAADGDLKAAIKQLMHAGRQ
eukprot:TRINITY_DN325_c0_g1_i1.p1 TRINITY_DN325_c0_g1~~TRINITY_DN325_c0_g1_i1.p1  ORF type:complete len:529 (-),score=199.08 TRINITY_DN325_c0_g1_i1:330-1916(-)